MIKTHRAQRSFGDGLIAEEVKDLREAWMKHADQLLGDLQIVAAVYEALAKRRPQSRKRGRPGVPAEVVLRLLVVKHMRNWSYGVLEREVRANLVYRDFTRVGGTKMPDAKTMGKWGVALGPEVISQIHERIGPAAAKGSAGRCPSGRRRDQWNHLRSGPRSRGSTWGPSHGRSVRGGTDGSNPVPSTGEMVWGRRRRRWHHRRRQITDGVPRCPS